MHSPSLIISDCRTHDQPGKTDPITVLREELGADLPAILITGDTTPERLREAKAQGVTLVHKPISPEQLRQRLERIVWVGHSALDKK
jgi:CheY-like chemotaxis protein